MPTSGLYSDYFATVQLRTLAAFCFWVHALFDKETDTIRQELMKAGEA
jgi:hypothetical protein